VLFSGRAILCANVADATRGACFIGGLDSCSYMAMCTEQNGRILRRCARNNFGRILQIGSRQFVAGVLTLSRRVRRLDASTLARRPSRT
jgi:hypothetical protein